MAPRKHSILAALLLRLVRLYQYVLSPWVGQSCRFFPTCSHYAADAVKEHGAIKGSLFAAKRLACCHPWCEGGYDPVPARRGREECNGRASSKASIKAKSAP